VITIEVLGPGCNRCKMLFERASQAARELGLECEVVKLTDINLMLSHGVVATPALVVDGQVKVSGRVPSVEQLKALLLANP
jgi:small redox-active disulfide protein 2